MLRVLKPGGTAIVLEFSKPTVFPVKQVYHFYFKRICPLVGKLFSKDERAYSYLNESVAAFPAGKDFLDILTRLGFKNCEARPVSFGIATIYKGEK
jgi:demethylmenaquinone methyltransferase/2-methoxy-6-polyprenyl-1,4-benzoquinol methylase